MVRHVLEKVSTLSTGDLLTVTYSLWLFQQGREQIEVLYLPLAVFSLHVIWHILVFESFVEVILSEQAPEHILLIRLGVHSLTLLLLLLFNRFLFILIQPLALFDLFLALLPFVHFSLFPATPLFVLLAFQVAENL